MAAPTSISAVESNRLSILFYVRDNGDVAALTAQKSPEDPANPEYKTSSVILNGNTVRTPASQLSAVAYKLGSSHEIRIYYINGNEDDGFQLKELCQSNGGQWYEGKLDKLGLNVNKDSLISANVEDGSGDLKVFFQHGKTKKPWVAWVVLGQTTWSDRKISESW